MTTLPDKYRPKLFEDVRGQERAVNYLSGLIKNGQACRNVLLHGSIGSGKTTLVRIYAKALNCQQPSASGSPCLRCEPCSAGREDNLSYAELDAPQFRKPEELKDRVATVLSADNSAGRRRLIFIDEAHTLSSYKDSFDFLLKTVEEPPERTSFCFATTAFERISAALRSRLFSLRIRPLSLEQSVGYLRDVAIEENIEFEREALALIAGIGEGQPRNMLQALDQVSDEGNVNRAKVTRERVIDMYGISPTEQLCQYFMALGTGDFALQTKLFFDWNEPVKLKVNLIQLFLFSLYYNEICACPVSIDPVIASIGASDREPILDAFRDRLGAGNLKHFWEDLMAAWPGVTSAMSDEGLLALIIAFQRVANRSGAVPRPESLPIRVPDPPAGMTQVRKRNRMRPSVPRDLRPRKIKRDPNFLTIDNALSLIHSSSFLVQEYGVQFNAQITIRHRNFGCKTQAEASDHFGKFSSRLKSRLIDWTGYGHRLCVQEADQQEGFCGRVVAFIPDAGLLDRWSKRWHREERLAGHEETAISSEILPFEERLQGHWSCVRWICGGLNPEETLAPQLKIEDKYKRIAGDIGKRTRYSTSESITATRIKEVEEEYGLGVLSAVNDGQWERLYDGWELDEHQSRMQHKRLRQAAIHEVRQRHEGDNSPEAKAGLEAELAELRAGWPSTDDRERSWSFWRSEQ